MVDEQLKRVRYFDGQRLTAIDFRDEQNYHRNMFKQFTSRFPTGIIRGFDVTVKNAENIIHIGGGVAVDRAGRIVVVGEDGINVPLEEFFTNPPYLSVKFTEKETRVGHVTCDQKKENNRYEETVEHIWVGDANTEVGENDPAVTVAKIIQEDDGSLKRLYKEEGSETSVREEAGLIEEKYVVFDGTKGHDHSRLDIVEGVDKGAQIPTNGLKDLAVTGAKIAAEAIGTDQIAPEAVTGDKIADEAIDTDQIAPEAVTDAKIAAEAIGTDQIAPEAVTGAKIADEAIDTDQIAPEAVTGAKIADEAVDTDQIAPEAVTSEKLSLRTEGDHYILAPGTNTKEYTLLSYNQDRIRIVEFIPTDDGEIIWKIEGVEKIGTDLKYYFSVENSQSVNIGADLKIIEL
jgi:hypothetical protein